MKRMQAKAPAPLFTLAPYMPQHPLMRQAWVDCLMWAVGEEGLMTAFREETGCAWTPGRTPLDRMIDEATGADVAFLEAFLPWFNRNIWGEEGGKAIDREDERSL